MEGKFDFEGDFLSNLKTKIGVQLYDSCIKEGSAAKFKNNKSNTKPPSGKSNVILILGRIL